MKKLECLEQTAPNVWEIYDELQEIVYVVDIDSYELAYMNRFARKVYGVESMEEVQGKNALKSLWAVPCLVPSVTIRSCVRDFLQKRFVIIP